MKACHQEPRPPVIYQGGMRFRGQDESRFPQPYVLRLHLAILRIKMLLGFLAAVSHHRCHEEKRGKCKRTSESGCFTSVTGRQRYFTVPALPASLAAFKSFNCRSLGRSLGLLTSAGPPDNRFGVTSVPVSGRTNRTPAGPLRRSRSTLLWSNGPHPQPPAPRAPLPEGRVCTAYFR